MAGFGDAVLNQASAEASLAERCDSAAQTVVKSLGAWRPRIGLLGPYHSRNLGDTAIQLAVIQNFVARCSDPEIVGISPDPMDTTRSLGIPAFPLSGCGVDTLSGAAGHIEEAANHPNHGPSGRLARLRAIARMTAFLRKLDLLVVSGGGQLDDFWGGAFGHPLSLVCWVVLARLCGVRIAFVGVGMDRLSTPLSRFFVLSALRLAHYRSFRDKGTLDRLQQLGLRTPSRLCPDLAFSFAFEPVNRPDLGTRERMVVVNPISEHTWASDGDVRHDTYMDGLTEACAWLSARGFHLRLVCSQAKMDESVATELARRLLDKYSIRVEICDAPGVSDFLEHVRDARLVIASRLHAAILSLVAGAPVVAVAPLRKVTQLMEDVGLGAYCVELQSVTAADLIHRISTAMENESQVRGEIERRTQRFRRDLAKTYDDVAALIPVRLHDVHR